MPYKLFGTTTSGGPGFNILVCEAKVSHTTEIVFKSKLYHEERNDFGFALSYGLYANSDPNVFGTNGESFWFQGGPNTINGYNNEPLQFAFDFSFFYCKFQNCKIIACPLAFTHKNVLELCACNINIE